MSATETVQRTAPSERHRLGTEPQAPRARREERRVTEEAEVGRAAIKGVAWTGLQTWGYNFTAMAVFVALARLLAPADFGLAAAAMVVIQLVRVIVDAGFGRGLIRRREITDLHADTAFWTALGIGLAFTAAVVACAPLIADAFGQPRLDLVVRVLSVIFIFAALDSTQVALLQRRMQFRLQAIRRLIATVLSGAVAIALASLGAGVWSLVVQQLTLEALTVSLLWTMTTWRPRLRFSTDCFSDLISFGANYSGIRVLTYLGMNVDNLLIGVFLGPVALGIYVIAYRVLFVLNELLSTTINIVAFPAFARLSGDRTRINGVLCRTSRTAATIAFPLYGGLAVAARPLIIAVFGARWAQSGTVLQVLAIAGIAQSQAVFLTSYALAIGRVRNELLWTLTVVGVEIGGFLIVVHSGIVAVAAVVALVLVCAWLIRTLFVRAWGGPALADYFAQLPQILAATLVLAGVAFATQHALPGSGRVLVLAAQAVLGSIAYVSALKLLSPSSLESLYEIAKHLRYQAPAPVHGS